MRVRKSIQLELICDPVRSKFAMVVPVLEASLFSLKRDRIERLGGIDRITLYDLAREFRAGSGDAGICFEWAVHEAIASQDPLIYPLASQVLEDFCNIAGGSHSLLFGPEKDGAVPILESIQNALTEDSRVYVGNRGQPPKLKRYIPQVIRAFRRNEERNRLPRCISGLWKADLFLGNSDSERWVGTSVKVNPRHLEGARGLRIGIYPKQNAEDHPRLDRDLNLVRLPLPYDGAFMEVFYKSFFLVSAFLKADARTPDPVHLPDAEDRYITDEIAKRRDHPILKVLDVLRAMSQDHLLVTEEILDLSPTATISEAGGLIHGPGMNMATDYVSISPRALE